MSSIFVSTPKVRIITIPRWHLASSSSSYTCLWKQVKFVSQTKETSLLCFCFNAWKEKAMMHAHGTWLSVYYKKKDIIQQVLLQKK